jgi:hypothetical protein
VTSCPPSLKALALLLLQALVVGHLLHQVSNLGAELPFEFLECGVGILHCVVKQPGRDERRISPDVGSARSRATSARWFTYGSDRAPFRRWSVCLWAANSMARSGIYDYGPSLTTVALPGSSKTWLIRGALSLWARSAVGAPVLMNEMMSAATASGAAHCTLWPMSDSCAPDFGSGKTPYCFQ